MDDMEFIHESFHEEDDDDHRRGGGVSSSGLAGRSRRNKLLRSIRRRFRDKNGSKGDENDSDMDDESYDNEDEENGRYMGRRKSKKKEGKRRKSAMRRMSLAIKRDSNPQSMRNSLSFKHNGGKGDKNNSLFMEDDEEEREDEVVSPLPQENKEKKTKAGKKRRFGLIKRALIKSRRGRKSGQSSDRSVDSPPSVASTDNSMDNLTKASSPTMSPATSLRRPASLRASTLAPLPIPFPSKSSASRLQNPSSSTNGYIPGVRRAPDDENGFKMEAAKPDYYYQSPQWVLKNWFYFLTVVLPLSMLYWCFIGLFHSATFQQLPIWKRAPIHNIFFLGMGCTLRSSFMARQALDSRGVNANTHVRVGRIRPKRSRHNRSRSRSKGAKRRGLGDAAMRKQRSFWDDIEKMVSVVRKPSLPKRGLHQYNNHASTLEIYEFHANDERVGVLLGGRGGEE